MNRLEGKVAIVTGGNAGIGEAVAKRFAEEGAAVVITGRRQAELDRVMNGIRHNKGKGLAVAGSVTDERHVRDVTQRTLDSFGCIDILVNNAGIGDFGKRIHETDDATWATLLDVNLTGVFRMTRAVVPQMLKQGRGAIVNISSVASLVGIPGAPAYAASKGGVDALTRALAIDYAKDGLRCNIVNPGLIDTQVARDVVNGDEQAYADIAKHVPIGRAGRPEEIASVVLWLCSPGASYVVGHALTVDGGSTVG